jgi:hypothetical protein
MPRAAGYLLASGAVAAGLAWADWPGAAANPATLMSRVDVIATVLMLAGLPLLSRSLFGPVRKSWLARLVRACSYAAVCALMLVKADVQKAELAKRSGAALAGVWAGEVVFVIVIAVYLTALLAMTARRPPASPKTLTLGIGAGLALGLAICVLRPLANHVHISNPWLAGAYDISRFAAVLLVPCAAIKVGIAAARRASRRDTRLPLADARARQGVAAGLCVGIVAGLLVSVLGISTIALVPHLAGSIQWTLPTRLATDAAAHPNIPNAVSAFEVSFTYAAAGYLLVLIIFPLLGAGLGAWGGLYAAGPSQPPGGGGGGGGGGPEDSEPPPSGGGAERAEPGEPPPGRDEFPAWDELEEFPELDPEAEPEQVPEHVGLA